MSGRLLRSQHPGKIGVLSFKKMPHVLHIIIMLEFKRFPRLVIDILQES